MPKALRVCAVPGCPELTDTTRCLDHTKRKRQAQDAKRPSASARGYDHKWRTTRSRYLAAYPHCEHPGCPDTATDVDHIDGLGPNGPHGHDWHNLRSYCKPHHSQRTARDQPGGWNQR